MFKPLASASLAFVALAAPQANACDHLQSLGMSCAACNVASAPAHATSSATYTETTVTRQLAPVIRYEVRPVLSDVVIPDPLPEVPEEPVVQPVQPSCNAYGAASGLSYSHSYSTHGAFSGGNAFGSGYNAHAAGSAHGYRAVQQQAIRHRNRAVHATATVRAVRSQDVQYGYGYDASANGVQANGKVKALPRLRNAVGSLFGKP